MSAGSIVATAVDPLGVAASGAIGSITGFNPLKSLSNAVTGTLSSWVGPLTQDLFKAGLYIVFVVAGLGMIVLGIARLTKGPRQAAEHAAGTIAKTGASVAAVAL